MVIIASISLNQSHQRATKSGAKIRIRLSFKSKAVTTMKWDVGPTKSDLDSCKTIKYFVLLLVFGGCVEQSILIIISNFSEVSF